MPHPRWTIGRSRAAAACAAGLCAAVLFSLVLAAPAPARSGHVGPERPPARWTPGETVDRLLGSAWIRHGIWDAQATGALTYTMTEVSPELTMAATDADGAPVWSLAAGDASAATGTLPAALVAVFADPDPNVLRSGELRAYNADGSVRFRRAFVNKYVEPLCDTPTRLVWAEVSAQRVTRVFVRQGSTTRSVALPYRPPKASFVNPASASSNGGRLAIGIYMHKTDRWRTMMYWLRVDGSGAPRIVSGGVTDWPYLALSPDGSHAAVMSSRTAPVASPNLWVEFGKFGGRLLPGEGAAEIGVAKWRIFEQGGYSYQGDGASWSTTSVCVVDWGMQYMYQRAWVWEDASSSIWFRHDPSIFFLAGVDSAGALTVINVDTYAVATVPGTYADAVPIEGGTMAVMTTGGALSLIVNPVAAPQGE